MKRGDGREEKGRKRSERNKGRKGREKRGGVPYRHFSFPLQAVGCSVVLLG